MPIVKSVGHSGKNEMVDVMVIQTLLNLNRARFPGTVDEIRVDGRIGPVTIAAIERFEATVMNLPEPDGMVAPGDATVVALVAGLEPGPSKAKLQVVMPVALPENIDRYYDALVAGLTRYDITTDLRVSHFVAQIGHESASFRYTEELASGAAYEGRADLGNTQVGDGRRFKGRGLIQLTGRANYKLYSQDTGVDYLSDPGRVSMDPMTAVDVACWFWQRKDLNALADRDDVKRITYRINAGYNGLDDRMAYLHRAKSVLRMA